MSSFAKPLSRALTAFLKAETTAGAFMLLVAAMAMLVANSSLAAWYADFIEAPIALGLGAWTAAAPLKHVVKDVLMVFFFLMIGMELKREMLEGFLADRTQILLPLFAALGGMLLPAGVFLLVNHSEAMHWNGWAIPSATDIAFAVCVLMLAGKHVPPALKVFLLAIAIFDDLGAILVIAFFYSGAVNLLALLMVMIGLATLYALNRLRVMRVLPYLAVGVVLWFLLHHAGIHTTIAGVAVGMAIPLRDSNAPSRSPLNGAMHFLHPWVSFLVLPLFAFTSAGINLAGINLAALLAPLPLGVALGLFVGKQLGIFGTTWLLVKAGVAKLPQGSGWIQIYGVALLAGIGFTMSLFIGFLAFDDETMQNQVKLGVMTGSLLSALVGAMVIRLSTQR
jgi:Na+:H+ antiporter, NhaA family